MKGEGTTVPCWRHVHPDVIFQHFLALVSSYHRHSWLASVWIGSLLNSSLPAGHSKFCFGCDFCSDRGHRFCQCFLVVCVCVRKVLATACCLIYYVLQLCSCPVLLLNCDFVICGCVLLHTSAYSLCIVRVFIMYV